MGHSTFADSHDDCPAAMSSQVQEVTKLAPNTAPADSAANSFGDALAKFPRPSFLFTFRIAEHTGTMLFAILPLTTVPTSIRPIELSYTMLLIGVIFALIATTIIPSKTTFPIHLIHIPLSSVFSAITPRVDPMSVDVVSRKLSLI